MEQPKSAGNERDGLVRDPRLSWFGAGGRYDKALPSGRMLEVLEDLTVLSGPVPGSFAPAAPVSGSSVRADHVPGIPLPHSSASPSGSPLPGRPLPDSSAPLPGSPPLRSPARGGQRPLVAATDDEVVGMMDRWEALEAHAEAGKLAAIREIIRRRARRPRDGFPAARYPGDLPAPAQWDIGVAHEVAAQLRISWQAADPLVLLAWELEARLPEVGAFLDHGVISPLKAKIIVGEFSVLDDEKIAAAQRLLLEEDLGADDMTPGRLRRFCQRIVDTVDPEGQRKRREQAEREHARVSFFRAHGGDSAMFACGLPADGALMAQANIQQRALEYRKMVLYPDAGMDLLRVLALVDLVNGWSLDDRIAKYHVEKAADDARQAAERAADREALDKLGVSPPPAPDASPHDGSGGPEFGWPDDDDVPADEDDPDFPDDRGGPDDDPDRPAPPVPDEEPDDLDPDPGNGWYPDHASPPKPGNEAPGNGETGPGGTGPRDDDPGGSDLSEDEHGGTGPRGDGPGGNGPGRGGPGGGGPGGSGSDGSGSGGVPGKGRDPGLPALAHLTLPLATLLGLAERPGEALGHGSVDPALTRQLAEAAAKSPRTRFCLTITDGNGYAVAHGCATLLRENREGVRSRQATGPPHGLRDGPSGGWSLTRDHARAGADNGYGAWILTVSGGRRYRVETHEIPLHDCDHRYATDSYRPGTLLRHLVEIRDGECTFTGCSHPADHCDFEHALPYEKGGTTDACNAGARSRRCHQVKQSRGWSVTQPEPGWHRWQAPSGRSYTKAPKRYPA
ncbi:MAG TPA: DUF222 domain-containing protein [Trebonia sp.]